MLKSLGLLLGRFACVYVPAFAVVGVLQLPIEHAVPVIIVITVTIALLLMRFSAPRGEGLEAFGFRAANARTLGWTAIISLPLAIASAVSLTHFREPGPLAGMHLQPWAAILYFGAAAPVQEEIIFRGLLQTRLASDLSAASPSASRAAPVAVVGILFALIHLEVGPLTACFALILGLLTGELRRRSGSLIPAILAHSIFNVAASYPGG